MSRLSKVLQFVFALPDNEGLQVATDTAFAVARVKLIEQIVKKRVSPKYLPLSITSHDLFPGKKGELRILREGEAATEAFYHT